MRKKIVQEKWKEQQDLIKEIRLELGFTQQKLSEASKISRRTICYIESGAKIAKPETIKALFTALRELSGAELLITQKRCGFHNPDDKTKRDKCINLRIDNWNGETPFEEFLKVINGMLKILGESQISIVGGYEKSIHLKARMSESAVKLLLGMEIVENDEFVLSERFVEMAKSVGEHTTFQAIPMKKNTTGSYRSALFFIGIAAIVIVTAFILSRFNNSSEKENAAKIRNLESKLNELTFKHREKEYSVDSLDVAHKASADGHILVRMIGPHKKAGAVQLQLTIGTITTQRTIKTESTAARNTDIYLPIKKGQIWKVEISMNGVEFITPAQAEKDSWGKIFVSTFEHSIGP